MQKFNVTHLPPYSGAGTQKIITIAGRNPQYLQVNEDAAADFITDAAAIKRLVKIPGAQVIPVCTKESQPGWLVKPRGQPLYLCLAEYPDFLSGLVSLNHSLLGFSDEKLSKLWAEHGKGRRPASAKLRERLIAVISEQAWSKAGENVSGPLSFERQKSLLEAAEALADDLCRRITAE